MTQTTTLSKNKTRLIGPDSILNDPFLSQLDAMQEGRYVILSEDLDGAFSFSSALSLGYVNEALVPQLAAALGDSADDAGHESADQDFPVTIEHKFGSTTISAEPERVITVGDSHIGDLDASAQSCPGGVWSATITILVVDGSESPVANATVYGS